MILAAGLGTRLKPWTLEHPKALVPVGGVPMLQRVIGCLEKEGFDRIVVNIHHFGDQIVDFLNDHDLGVEIRISDERAKLLDTGGGILKASELLMADDDRPFLIHNVDILSNARLNYLMRFHEETCMDITLLTSGRVSSRQLVFSSEGFLRGWHDLSNGHLRPDGFEIMDGDVSESFSGIYVIGANALKALRKYSYSNGVDSFPILDFFLACSNKLKIGRYYDKSLELIDIGKPASLERAQDILS